MERGGKCTIVREGFKVTLEMRSQFIFVCISENVNHFCRKTGHKKKLNTFIQFPEVMDMSKYVGKPGE